MLRRSGVYDKENIQINTPHIRDPPNVRSYRSERVSTGSDRSFYIHTPLFCRRIRNKEKEVGGKRSCVK
jgi:hypothetical protein